MADDSTIPNPPPPPEKPSLHPAYTVTNITTKIRTLDGKKVTYSAWVKLFNLHLRAYKVLHHIDGTNPPASTDPTFAAWSELDALILQWIFSTVSDDILARVLESDQTARSAWLKIQEIFINNKQARAVTLETRFSNTTLKSCTSFEDYCQTLKDLSEQLKDIDQPVTESRLVIQMVRGLPIEFDTIAAIINREKPSWEVARSMIEDEQSRQAARSDPCDTSLFIFKRGLNMAYLLLYVDDIVLTANHPSLLKHFIHQLSAEFAMTDLGNLHHFLGITVTRGTKSLFLCQTQYARDILHRANMTACKPCQTPVDTNAKLSAAEGTPLPD
ncbi:putative RNA-directed DNA polymerase [Helianthus debilis subsp. tardiflorus]